MGRLTICLLNWRRPDNLHRIVNRLRKQAAQPVLFLWNQSGKPFLHHGIDWQIDSTRNLGCWPRWLMAAQAVTEFVGSLDDDLMPADDRLLADAVDIAATLPDDQALGAFGVILDPAKDYSAHRRAQDVIDPTAVDVVKGRLLIARTAPVQACRPDTDAFITDDIALCGSLAAGRPRRHLVHPIFAGRLLELPTGRVGCEDQPDHYARREAARQVWFPGS